MRYLYISFKEFIDNFEWNCSFSGRTVKINIEINWRTDQLLFSGNRTFNLITIQTIFIISLFKLDNKYMQSDYGESMKNVYMCSGLNVLISNQPSFRSKIKGNHQSMVFKFIIKVFKNNTSTTLNCTRCCIDIMNFVHQI